MDKDISSEYILFSNKIFKQKIKKYFIMASRVQTKVNYNLVQLNNEHTITNSFLLWTRIEASAGDQFNIQKSVLLGVDIINRNTPNSAAHKNIKYQNAVIISKNQLLISIVLVLGLYFLQKRWE
ncbi:hypothetical protein EKK58_04145 [Candidatus Dependentiae bacterium]|nr:MAG: hypothetical protein EKK58_04145 [Candidatus Dependentiae bacterium]